MTPLSHVCIGIQARSASTRFPRKIFEFVGGKTVLGHVLDTCDSAAFYLNRHSATKKIQVSYVLLCPYQDELIPRFETRVQIIEGPNEDVLSRYKLLLDKINPDYIVRITSDCPLIYPDIISTHITIATKNQYDYCSNVDERVRTALDGHDCEVISRRALLWAHENTKDQSLREHVTPLLRTNRVPEEFRRGCVLGFLNQSHLKLSVDTPEDLDRVRVEHDRFKQNYDLAVKMYGKRHVHKI